MILNTTMISFQFVRLTMMVILPEMEVVPPHKPLTLLVLTLLTLRAMLTLFTLCTVSVYAAYTA